MVESICDSDILIKLIISDILKILARNQKTIFVSDIVSKEIKRLSNTLNDFSYVHDKIFKEDNKIKVIHYNEFTESELKEINYTLSRHGISCNVQTLTPIKNMGEFVSLIYADYKGINIVRSDDKGFVDKIKESPEYNHIEIKNLNDTVREIPFNDIERISIMKTIEEESKKFANDKIKKTSPFTIDDLMEKFNAIDKKNN